MPRYAGNSRLHRLIDHWSGTEGDAARTDIAERLALWMDVHDALQLQQALQLVASGEHGAAGDARAVADAATLAADCRRLRAALTVSVTAEEGDPALGSDAGFAAYHRRYLAHQRRMQAGVDALRGRARQSLSSASPALARLAMLDGTLQQLLGAREQKLFASIPLLLKERFERLNGSQPDPAGAVPLPLAWFDTFRRDVQEVLLAELDARLQPVLGMIDALGQETGQAS